MNDIEMPLTPPNSAAIQKSAKSNFLSPGLGDGRESIEDEDFSG
jgi:hypothetical protein